MRTLGLGPEWSRGGEAGLDREQIVPAVQIQAGLVFQAYASDIAEEGLSAAFGELAGRMIGAATKKRRQT